MRVHIKRVFSKLIFYCEGTSNDGYSYIVVHVHTAKLAPRRSDPELWRSTSTPIFVGLWSQGYTSWRLAEEVTCLMNDFEERFADKCLKA